jgi:hypothetical protein
VSHVLSQSEKGNGGQSCEIEFEFIDVAPAPVFTGFQGLDYGMLGRMKVLGCVLVLRRIATTDMSAAHAQAQMHPLIVHL